MKELRRTEQIVRFGVFEVDLCSGDLRKAGLRIKLQDQPLKVLAALLEQHGQLVTREELRGRIWPEESFGDFDHAVHIAIGKLRIALGDSAEAPRFIERGRYLVDPDGGVPIKAPTGLITWSRDGNWIYFSEQDEIYKRPAQGGEATLVAKGVLGRERCCLDAKESVDGKWLYFTQGNADSEIRIVSSSGGEHRPLAGMPNVRDATDWTLARNGIFYLDCRAQPVTINFFEFSTKEIRQIVTLNKPPAIWGGLSLSPDGKWLAYSQVDDTPSYIMLVDHFH